MPPARYWSFRDPLSSPSAGNCGERRTPSTLFGVLGGTGLALAVLAVITGSLTALSLLVGTPNLRDLPPGRQALLLGRDAARAPVGTSGPVLLNPARLRDRVP